MIIRYAYAFTVGVVEGLELDDVGVADNAHDLEFTVLRSKSANSSRVPKACLMYLEPLILKNTLDGSVLSRWRQLGLENHTEGTISDNFALGILQVSGLASHSILNLFTDHLCNYVSVEANAIMARSSGNDIKQDYETNLPSVGY